MAVAEGNQNVGTAGVAKLHTKPKGDSLWLDAWRRLRRNRLAVVGIVIIILAILMAIFADQIAPKGFGDQMLADNNAAPQWVTNIFPNMVPKENGGYVTINNSYALGADNLGRDLLSRIIYGSRVSLAVAFIGPLVSLLVGISFGLISGYAGGRVDNLMMRFVDIMYAFPTLLLVILLMAFFRSSFAHTEPGTFQYAVGQTRSVDGRDAVHLHRRRHHLMDGTGAAGARANPLGARKGIRRSRPRPRRRMRAGSCSSTCCPNILGPVIISETLTIPTYISYEAFLSFIGLGVNPPTPSWGAMISDGSRSISSFPNQAIFPAVALFLVMFAFNFLGDGLRDALDPRMRGVD